MPGRISAFLCLILLSACAVPPPPDTAELPPGFYGTWIDNDLGAINESSWALGSPARTRDDPIEALQAVIAVEYLGGELNSSPRWFEMSPLTKMQMLQARQDMRQVLGIAPGAPSQLVENVLITTLVALQRHDMATAMKALSAPIFSHPPQQTMQVLSNLPYVPAARAATASAEQELMRPG